MDYKRECGKRLKKAREERGWKMHELSDATGGVISVSRINNYEHGARMPGPSEAVLLAKALGKRPAYFLGVDDMQMVISVLEESLVRNWRALPENDRMRHFRQIENESLIHRDPVQDQQVEKHIPLPKKLPAPKKVKRTPTR